MDNGVSQEIGEVRCGIDEKEKKLGVAKAKRWGLDMCCDKVGCGV